MKPGLAAEKGVNNAVMLCIYFYLPEVYKEFNSILEIVVQVLVICEYAWTWKYYWLQLSEGSINEDIINLFYITFKKYAKHSVCNHLFITVWITT